MVIEEQVLDESYEAMEFLKTFYPHVKAFFNVSFETFVSALKTTGKLLYSSIKYVFDYDFSRFNQDLKWLLKQFTKAKNLSENAIVDIISSILSSKIFWIIICIFLLSNVFGAISTIISAKTVIASTTALTGTSTAVATTASVASSAILTAFINAGLAATAAIIAIKK